MAEVKSMAYLKEVKDNPRAVYIDSRLDEVVIGLLYILNNEIQEEEYWNESEIFRALEKNKINISRKAIPVLINIIIEAQKTKNKRLSKVGKYISVLQ